VNSPSFAVQIVSATGTDVIATAIPIAVIAPVPGADGALTPVVTMTTTRYIFSALVCHFLRSYMGHLVCF
jgi:hypothetical protein